MGKRTFGPSLKGGTGSSTAKPKSSEDSSSLSDFVKRLKEQARKDRPYLEEYRKRSIEIHGNFCAKCGREFSGKDLRLLTVHHKDGNHHNNPPDGSNWENLCVYCHEDEHSREVYADSVSGLEAGAEPARVQDGHSKRTDGSAGFNTLRDALEKALKKKKE
jgi:hypothetical protein